MPPQTPSDQSYPNPAQPSQAVPADQTQPIYEQTRQQYYQPAYQTPQQPAPQQPATSRRAVLRGALGAGVVVAAAAAGAGAVVAFANNDASKPEAKPSAMAPMQSNAMEGPLVVYISDTTTGQFDVFGGTGATQVKNPALVKALLDNLKLA